MTGHGTLCAVHWLDACIGEPEEGLSGLCASIAVGYASIRGSALRVTPHVWGNGETDGTMMIPLAWVREIRALNPGRTVQAVDLMGDASEPNPCDPQPLKI